MSYCLEASSQCLKQCWLITNSFCCIHMRAISKEILTIPNCQMSLKITFLKLLLHLQGANELNLILTWPRPRPGIPVARVGSSTHRWQSCDRYDWPRAPRHVSAGGRWGSTGWACFHWDWHTPGRNTCSPSGSWLPCSSGRQKKRYSEGDTLITWSILSKMLAIDTP